MNGSVLVAKTFNKVGNRDVYKGEFVTLEVEGAKELDVLNPVLKSTGFRGSFVDAITMVSEKNSRLAEVLTQELPPLYSDDSISDTDKLRLLASRLDTGSFAEQDRLADALGRVAKEFLPDAKVDEVVETIKFDKDNSSAQEIVNNV